MTLHPLTNFETQRYYQHEPRFNEVYSRDNVPDKIKDGAYVINIYKYSYWIALYVLGNNATYFCSFGVEHIPKEFKRFIGNKKMQTIKFRIQAYDSVMCGCYCIGFIHFILKGKSISDLTNIFSPNNVEDSNKIILKYI